MKHTGITMGLAALLTLFFLSSCIETDSTLGSALVPANQDISIHSVTLDIPVSLRMADSLQTTVSNSARVGAIRTDDFGLFHADAAFSVTPATDSIIWGKNPKVRNIYLNLVRDTALVVDDIQRSIPQNIYVHQLSVELDSSMAYHNSLGPGDYDPTPINDGGCIYTGGDTYEVRLSHSFGEKLFQIPMATLDSAELFMKAFYGLYLRCDDPDEDLNAGRINVFDLSSSYIYLNYTYEDDEGARRAKTVTFNLGSYYAVTVCDSGARDLEREDPRDIIYVEGLCGIKPHIDARELRAVVASWAEEHDLPIENMLVAKATLSFPFEYDGDRTQFDHFAKTLFPCKRVRSSKRVNYTPLDEINDTALENGAINRSKLTYTSNISLYLQNLLRKDPNRLTADDDLWMMPTVSVYDSYASTTYYFADYYYYTQSYLNGTADERHPVLNLTYTILK